MGIGLLAVVVLLTAAAAAMFWPLRNARNPRVRAQCDTGLEIARDAKLGEIKDLELDFHLGKLSADDYEAVNAALRAEAVEIMRQIDECGASGRRPRDWSPRL